ncbi:MAG: PQQ-binding-like beta-propeller repeat protein [Herpetosiphonaceae bacterium]|nr:PQQ-binding-like beta-propeller repeat protein [Herpetosiphonaceae bacterium]
MARVRQLTMLITLVVGLTFSVPVGAGAAGSGAWTTYGFDNARTGYNPNETTITPATAANLTTKWTAAETGNTQGITAQPVTNNGTVYWGSWDGYEHATNASTGTQRWSRFLGLTSAAGCNPPVTGVANTATVASLSINGQRRSVLFVGGGGNVATADSQARLYALDALTGAVLWKTDLGPAPATFMWSSPAYFNGSVYVGIASFGDCPLVQGRLVKLDATTGVVQTAFNVVQDGCTGGGIWSSPAIDEVDGTLYFSTGNPASCSTQPYGIAIVELRLADLSVVGYWSVPFSSQVDDGDFGATPVLFTAKSGALLRRLVGVANKNGLYYAFSRNHLTAGPVWKTRVAVGGDCPQCGSGSIGASASDGTSVFVAGGSTTINGVNCFGSVQALNPGNGQVLWQVCFSALSDGPVLGAVSVIPGVVLVGEGNSLVLIDAASGTTLKQLTSQTGAAFWGTPSVSNGQVYIGDMSGLLYAFGL